MQVVIFSKDNVRIETSDGNPDKYKGLPNVAIDPDLSELDGVPPHFWKLLDGKVVAMDDKERSKREASLKKDKHYKEHLKDNYLNIHNKRKNIHIYVAIVSFIIGTIIGLNVR